MVNDGLWCLWVYKATNTTVGPHLMGRIDTSRRPVTGRSAWRCSPPIFKKRGFSGAKLRRLLWFLSKQITPQSYLHCKLSKLWQLAVLNFHRPHLEFSCYMVWINIMILSYISPVMTSISQYNSRIYKVLKLLICLNLRIGEYDVAP